MTLNQEETGPSTVIRGTTSLSGGQAWLKRDQADENEVNGVSSIRGKFTEKGWTYRVVAILKERREKINGSMVRKFSIIEDLLFSNKNRAAVEEELVRDVNKHP